MNNLGIIVEYNPFHNGHILHINNSKKQTSSHNVFAVISGNFVQRGTPAILNKYQRTKYALENGVDIVLELPTPYATSSAELFAHSAVSTLNKTNVIDSLCFGSESGNISLLKDIANVLVNEPPAYKEVLKNSLSLGFNFPKSRELAIAEFNPFFSTTISKPNNILGIEYLKALAKLNSPIKPFTITRNSSNYHDNNFLSENIASATSIRNKILDHKDFNDFNSIKNFVPFEVFDDLTFVLNKNILPNHAMLFSLLKYKILTTKESDLSKINGINKSILATMYSAISTSSNYYDYVNTICSKCYTKTRIQRLLLHILLNIQTQDIEKYKSLDFVPYIRVLGFKREKAFLLNELQEKASVPIITNLKNANISVGKEMLLKEFEYTNIYNLLTNNNCENVYKKIPLNSYNFEKRQPLVVI